MADTQIPVTAGTLPQGFCPETPQEMLDGFAEVMTVALPAANTTVIVSMTVTNEDIGKLWIRVDADGNPLGQFIYDADVGDWVRAQPHPFQPGFVQDFYHVGYADLTAAKAAILLLDQENEPNPNSSNPYWRLADGTNSTPDLQGRVTMGAGVRTSLPTRNFGDTPGVDEVTLDLTQIPKHQHTIGTEDGVLRNTLNGLYNGAGDNTGLDTPATHGAITEFAGGDPADSYNTAPHDNIQPSYVLYKIIRTSRMY